MLPSAADLQRFSGSDSDEEDEGQQIDDTYISKDNIAVDKDSGLPLAPKSMSLDDLRTELEAKGLSSEGNKTTLTRRIRVSSTPSVLQNQPRQPDLY